MRHLSINPFVARYLTRENGENILRKSAADPDSQVILVRKVNGETRLTPVTEENLEEAFV